MNDKERLSPKHYMDTLGCTYEEALQLIKDDRETERGVAHEWDVSKEDMKEALKIVRPDRSGTPKARPRKPNTEKRAIIDLLYKALAEVYESSITNPEKSIDFTGADGVQYTVSLVAHRKK